MPELPEVETIVRTLAPIVAGAKVVEVRLHRADILEPANIDLPKLLVGGTLKTVHRRAKRIVFTTNSDQQFYIHLGMSGRLSAEPPDSQMVKHTHLVLTIRKNKLLSQIRFTDPRRFGGVFWIGDAATATDDLGPEPLELADAVLIAQLAKTRRPIKTALLDQSIIAGIGNIYADESLFEAGIHPLTPAASLSKKQISKLNKAIKKILLTAINFKGSTLRDYRNANGESGGFQLQHKVYDREDQPCAKCQTPITRIVLGGRSTCFCVKCQKR